MAGRKRRCTGTTKAHKPCGANPLNAAGAAKLGLPAKNQPWCRAHHPDLPASLRFGSSEQAATANPAGRPAVPKVTDLMRERVEAAADTILRPYFRALGVVGWDLDGNPIVDPDARAKHVAKFKGDTLVSDVEDLGGQMEAAERLLDRVHGRPKQSTEITGEGGGPVLVTSGLDLSGLTEEELDVLERLSVRLAGPRAAAA